MEEFLTEHGGLIISGIIAIITLIVSAMIIWFVGKMNLVAMEQILGVWI